MAAGKPPKAKQPTVVPFAMNECSPAPTVPMQPVQPVTNGKKQKKKKGKGKEHQHTGIRDFTTGDGVPNFEDSDIPLPPMGGLSPHLESVRITTTGYVATSATGLTRPSAGVTTQLRGEILASSNDLHLRNIEVQSNGRTGSKAGQPISEHPLPKTNGAHGPSLADDEYWSSFPPHIKNFAQTMYNIAQQMVQSDTYLKNGTATATATMATKGIPGYPPGAYPPLPFDPSIFSDPAFTLSVEQAAAAALGAVPPAPGHPPRGPLPQTNVVLLNEYEGVEHEFPEDDYYSEDEVDGKFEDEDLEDEFDLQPHPARPPTGPNVSGPDAVAHVVLSYGETVARSPSTTTTTTGSQRRTNVSTKTSSTARPPEPFSVTDTKQNKHKKRKDADKNLAETPVARSVPNSAPAPELSSAISASESATEKGRGRPTATVDLTKRPPLTANAMPAARTATKENISANPPPSSRAQGKQPMSYATTTATTATTNNATPAVPGNGQQPARTARAASKAPITAHAYSHNHAHHHPSPPSSNASAPHKPRPPAGSATKGSQNNSKIWSTNTTEERERIKEFWLGLGEDERRNLVKIEKDTVLRKMKEQQKHSCSCAVCGRKRHAIEEELEVLYDAYYEELEQYANYQQRYVNSGGTLPPPPGPGPFPGSVELDKNGAVIGHPHTKHSHQPSRTNRTPALTNGRKHTKHESEFDDDEGDDDDYEEEDEYDDDDEEEEEEEEEEDDAVEEEEEEVKPRDRRNAGPRGRRPGNGTKANGRDGLFNLGSSLTVTGPNNILTVADDLLKNDGQKFLEMMEQLAERRMQREEEAAADVEEESDVEEEEEDDDEGDDDDDDEEDDEEDDDDDEEIMTEEQKMEEGKRMFSIFAARMFEQRVLQAYREKVAQERQQQLLRELEDEDKLTKEREAKKQTQNQKKKDKKKQQKLAKEEERASKAAEKAAEEVAVKAKQQAHEEELRKKKEEEKAKRETARKAAEEEKQRKEEERRKRLAEEREREAERERKRKEKEERARREREERERKTREEREAKAAIEKAAREAARKEQQEKEEREKKLTKEREEKAEKERLAQQQQTAAKNARQPTSPRASGSTQRSQSTNGSTKKILNKPVITPAPPVAPSRSTPQRPVAQTSQPATPVAPAAPSAFAPPVGPLYPPAPGMIPPLSILPTYTQPPPFGVFGSSSIQQGPPPPHPPPALPRGFGSPSPFDSHFSRLPQPAPIGPPSKAVQNPLASPTLLTSPARKSSFPEPGPGPVARPVPIAPIAPPPSMAPIARPTTAETSGSGSGSSVRRSPSPKGILGSSALAADDDEVVPPPGRRVVPGAVGQSWASTTSPRATAEARPPWGPPAPPPGFGSPRPLAMAGSLWGNISPEPSWQSAGFFPNAFVNHINPSPPPHAGN